MEDGREGEERKKEGKRVMVTNRKLWVDDVEWKLVEEEERWKVLKGE